MPDFKEINRLIESLEMLDRSFQKITAEYGGHEAKVKQACMAQLKKQSAEFLKEIPVEELKNSKAGIRINALQSAGYETLYDLYKAENWKLQNIEGIGEKQISSIRSIIGEFLNRLSTRARIRLTTDRDDIAGRTLIHEIAKFRKIEQIRREAGPLTMSVHETISALTAAVTIRSRFRWIFSFGAAKNETIRAIGDILTYCRSAEYNLVKSLISQYGEAVNMGVLDAMEDFKKNSASYYAIIERMTGAGAGAKRELVYSSVPAQLAEEIDAFALNLDGFKGNLRAYQEFGTRYILTMKRVLLGDEMGLGKTIQAIAAMTHLYGEDRQSRFLVVCPASVMINWCREIQKFSDIPVNLLHGPMLEDALLCWKELGGAAVTNYESMGKIVGTIDNHLTLSMLIIDEAHYIKNPEAKRTQYIHALDDESERILLMTGTPLENKVGEMCELIGFVRPDMVKNVRAYAGMRQLPAFREMLAPVYLRRQRDMVLDELPPLTVEEEWCEMTAEDSAAYGIEVMGGNFMGMRRVSFLQEDMRTSSKAQRLFELCEQAMEGGGKVIVYSYFRETIRKVCDFLGPMVIGSITGSTPPEERQDLIDRFSRTPDGAVLVCQVQAGGTGLNIQAAGIVIFCEPQIKPSLTWQAISRVYRMGQVQNVLVYHLLCENTVDEAMQEILAVKEEEFDMFAHDSAIAEAADGLADKEWIRQIVEREKQKYLPAVIND
jgi:SNF2 family DNA or RNA helicase